MPISSLSSRHSLNPKLAKAVQSLNSLLDAIGQKDIPLYTEAQINEIVVGINNFPGPAPQLVKQITASQASILKLLEKEVGLISKNHFQLQWLALGMAAFGIPVGVVFGAVLGNMAFIGIGLPIGLAIGIAVGTSKDTEAAKQGKQLDWSSS
ncbi:hypothetical protein [Algoriphagus aquimarinus]|uniref:hypothetical protein n=1 Tax=Algoriphagus aquimarinus TaxID=237018 RepID=UPI0030DB712F